MDATRGDRPVTRHNTRSSPVLFNKNPARFFFIFGNARLQSEREEPDTMAFGMLLAATSVLHPLQPQAAEQKYLWNVTVGDSFKTFEVMVHPDWCVLRSGH